MRILVHHRVASRDGQAVHLEELTEALRRAGHDIHVVGPRRYEEEQFGGSSGLVDGLKRHLPRWGFELLELGYNAVAFARLYRELRVFRPDVIYERFSLFLLAGIWVARLTRKPLLLEINSPLYEERAASDGISLDRLAAHCQAWLWRSADAALPVTGVLGADVRRAGVPESRIHVIPNGIDPRHFAVDTGPSEIRASLGLGEAVVIGFVGFIRQWNEVERLVRFVARHRNGPPVHALIVGDGPGRGSVEQLAQELDVADRVTVAGLVPRDRVATYVAAFDIALLPNVTPYSSPLKLFEYLALGKAVVAPAMPNIEEILTDGENARLFQPGDEASLDDCLSALVQDPATRHRLGAAAADTIPRLGLTWDANAARVHAIAEGLLGRP